MTQTTPFQAEELLQHAGWLRNLARSLVLDDSEADDVVQETWLAALRGGARASDPRGWLAGTLRNVVRMRSRSELRRRDREHLAAEPERPTSQDVVERERALLELLAALPEEQRATLLARYYDELPPRAIARRDGVALETVKSRLKRGLARLRAELDERHGDRRTWGLWLLPLAHESRSALASIAAGAALMLVAASAAVWLSPWRPFGAEPAVAPPALEGASPAGAVASTELESAEDRTERNAVDADPNGAPTRIVVLRDGKPVPGASVAVLDRDYSQEELEARAEYVLDTERFFIEDGTDYAADEDGVVQADLPPNALVRAWTDDAVRVVSVAASVEELIVELRPMPLVVVEVADSRGKPVDGLRVHGERTMRQPGSGEFGDERWGFTRRTSTGVARFHDPMGGALEGVPDDVDPTWTSFHLDVPGAVETSRAASARTSISQRTGESATLGLTAPPLGALSVEVLDSTTPREELDGAAMLEVRGPRIRGGERYSAPIVDGVAHWPHVVAGLEFDLKLSLHRQGASWETVALGPTREGESTTVQVARPNRPALSGRIVDAAGRPIAGLRLSAYHGIEGYEPLRHVLSLDTGEDGTFHLEWPDSAAVRGPALLEAWQRGQRGFAWIGERRDDLIGSRDLGDVTIVLGAQTRIEGRCVDADKKPLADVLVSATLVHGNSRGTRTRADGSFSFEALVDDTVRIEFRPESEALARRVLVLERNELASPLEVVFSAGASVALDVGALEGLAESSRATLTLEPETGEAADRKYVWLDEHGRGDEAGIAPGRYTPSLNLGGGVALATLPEIVLQDGETTHLEFPPLTSLVRLVEYADPHLHEGATLVARIVDAQGRRLTQSRNGRIAVPRTGTWTARFSASGYRTRIIEGAATLPDRVELQLAQPLVVTLVATSKPSGRPSLQLAGEPGTPAAGETVSLRSIPDVGEPFEVHVPAPGTYRLERVEERDLGGGVASFGTDATHVTIDVPAEPDPAQPIPIELR